MTEDQRSNGSPTSADELIQQLENIPEGGTLLGPKSTRVSYLFCYDHLIEQLQMSLRVKGMLFSKVVYTPNFKLAWPWFFPPMNTSLPTLYRTNDAEDKVWGILYDATGKDLTPLERHMKVPHRYHRRAINVMDRGGRRIPAFTYVLTVGEDSAAYPPSQAYIDKLIAAGEERNLPQAWLDEIRSLVTSE